MNEKKILMIDDDEELCQEISEILEDEGYNIQLVHDGKKGFDLLLSEHFDLVILDLKLPGMPGHEILTKIKSKKPDVTVFVITGSLWENQDVQNAPWKKDVVEKANKLFKKPFDIEVFLSAVYQLMQ